MQLHKEVKVGEIVRKIDTQQAWLVVGKNSQGLLVINLHDATNPAQVHMILPRANDLWQMDREITDLSDREVTAIEQALPLIEALEETVPDEDPELQVIEEEGL